MFNQKRIRAAFHMDRKMSIIVLFIVSFTIIVQLFNHSSDSATVLSTKKPTSPDFSLELDDLLERPPKNSAANDEHVNQFEPSPVTVISDYQPDQKLIIFPSSFPSDINRAYNSFGKVPENSVMIKYNAGSQRASLRSSKISDPGTYTSKIHKIDLFTSFKSINNDLNSCNAIKHELSVQASSEIAITASLTEIVTKFRDDNSQYYQDLKPHIGDDIDKHIKEGRIENHWFRLAGTSVWLEEYGVHYVISRVLYSREGIRNSPFVSLVYVQIFNENWEEMKDVHLILPTNDLSAPQQGKSSKTDDEIIYKEQVFPSFIPIAYHLNDKSKWYGPEDPRILLVKNKLGYQEPLIIFNSNHRLIKNIVDEGEGISTFHYDHFRTMFLAWPWQYQYGKKNVDGMSNPKYDNNLYTKVVELRIKGEKRSLQKNWTPFVSVRDRESNGDFDKYLYFVFRWSSIKVLKCDLVTESISIGSADPLECSVDYEIDPDYVEGEDVGAMRGGTELISIDELLTSSNKEGEYNSQLDKIVKNLPAGREIWIGVARANIKNCGCGGIIYRPNLAVITREGGKFKVHLISSFFSLDVDVAGWYLDKPNEKCVAELPNIYIPNGIAGWYFEKDSESIEDYMTLSFSLGDYTCHIIHLKGLLTSLINLDSNVEDKIFSKSINSENLGHNDDNIYCALQRSEQFCFDYGKENGWVEPPNKEE